MSAKTKTIGLAVVAALVVGLLYYTFTAPYNRFPGIRIGGELTAPPADFSTVEEGDYALLKLAGFPPFVVRVFASFDEDGIITATRPDNGYWGRRVRNNPDGWIRVGDTTFAVTATEITGDARIPYLEIYGGEHGMRMGYDFSGEVIVGQNEPLHTWEVFYWTPR